MKHRLVFSLLAICLASAPLRGAVFVVPSDLDLVRNAEVIMVGPVTYIQPRIRPDGGIETVIRITTSEKMKGSIGPEVTLYEAGGVVGDRATVVSGVPNYVLNERVLVFLSRDGEGRWTTHGMSLGKFAFVSDTKGRELLARFVDGQQLLLFDQEWRAINESPRMARDFLSFIRTFANGRRDRGTRVENGGDFKVDAEGNCCAVTDAVIEPRPEAEASALMSHYPPSAYVLPTFRWDRFDNGLSVSFRSSGTQPGYDSIGAIQRGMAAWNNDPSSNVNYLHSGTTSAGFVEDGINAVVFNSPTGVPPGAVGYSQIFANAIHTYKGEQFYSISEGDVVVRSNLAVSQLVFDEIVTHELGHTLGFRHSTDRAPSSTDAVMYPTSSGRFGASLGSWDREALSHVYTGPSGCVPTFADVPCTHPFFSYIETIRRNGITGGCAPGLYCPETAVTRAQMAIFLLRGKHGAAYNPPPATGQVFADVPANHSAAAWIEQLYREGITGGCGGGNYCPASPITRAQMSVFLLRSKYGSSYAPPPASGIFSDVPPSHPFVSWIEQLSREGITGGCAPSKFCPSDSVTRGQMAVFLVRTFNLQ